MAAGPALSAFAIFHSSECADVVSVPEGNGAVAERKVFCQGYRGDRGEPNRGIKGTLDHGNLLVSIASGGRRGGRPTRDRVVTRQYKVACATPRKYRHAQRGSTALLLLGLNE
jgi:hypothetical protein